MEWKRLSDATLTFPVYEGPGPFFEPGAARVDATWWLEAYPLPEFQSNSIREVSPGKYEIDVRGRKVVVDDFVPCIGNKPAFGFAVSSAGQANKWTVILQKAYAKESVLGNGNCYSDLFSGTSVDAITRKLCNAPKPPAGLDVSTPEKLDETFKILKADLAKCFLQGAAASASQPKPQQEVLVRGLSLLTVSGTKTRARRICTIRTTENVLFNLFLKGTVPEDLKIIFNNNNDKPIEKKVRESQLQGDAVCVELTKYYPYTIDLETCYQGADLKEIAFEMEWDNDEAGQDPVTIQPTIDFN